MIVAAGWCLSGLQECIIPQQSAKRVLQTYIMLLVILDVQPLSLENCLYGVIYSKAKQKGEKQDIAACCHLISFGIKCSHMYID